MKFLLVFLSVNQVTASIEFFAEEDNEPFRVALSGSSRVSERCSSHTDCVQGAYCESSMCRCLPSHVPLERYCWRKLNPEETGCTYDEQCEAVWPGTTCQYSICKCPPNTQLAITREGAVCHQPGHCPTNGLNGILYNRNSNSPAQCHFFDGETQGGSRFIGCDDFPELHDCIDGICCPTRALTCIQPLDTGISFTNQTISTLSRFFYNSIAQACQEFQYTGEGGNSNNFLTQEHCESYCRNRCPRGQPQLDTSIGLKEGASSEVVTCSASTDVCDDRFECVQMNGQNVCCPSSEFICSQQGGIVQESISIVAPTPVTPFSSGSYRHGTTPVSRWYWDSQSKKCMTFKYFGQGGNFNNFLSLEQCQEYCAPTICSLGFPLKDGTGQAIVCSNQAHCPRSHICTNGACCPTQGTVCNQPMSPGIACLSSPTKRYWFNAALGACQEFQYQGCRGNTNNFASYDLCQRQCASVEVEPKCPIGRALQMDSGRYWRCGQSAKDGACPTNYECHFDGKQYGCCPTKDFICHQPQEMGTKCSNPGSLRWFYSNGHCISFAFNGCDGNGNNFASQKECMDFCHMSECPEGGDPLIDDFGKTIVCRNELDVCPSSHQCVRSQSMNHLMVCCPTREHICRQRSDDGDSCTVQPLRRYVFDPSDNVCRPFSYLGCGGNSNNFPSKMTCFNFCHSAACAASEILYQTTTSSEIFDCSAKSCPRGYSCVQDVWNPQRRICCGAPNYGVCGAGERAYTDYRTQQPITCNPTVKTSCPHGFNCNFNTHRNNYFCCAEDVTISTCPDGSRVARVPMTGDPAGCSHDRQCDRQSKCHRPDPYRSGVCCQFLDNVCPPTFSYDEELTEGRPECSPLDRESCDPHRQSVCLFSEKKNRFVCCRREDRKVVTVERCPRGSVQDPFRVYCSPDKSCPPLHFCVRRDSDRVGICCSHPNLGRQGIVTTLPPIQEKFTCPKNQAPFIDSRTMDVQKCNALMPCPAPYTCTPTSFNSSVRICCGSQKLAHKYCDEGTLPISIDGIQYSCQIKSCPPGYRCVNDMCCPSKETACTELPFMGTECLGAISNRANLFFFDHDTGTCNEFEYRGCNPAANTFMDEASCEKMCMRKATIPPTTTTPTTTTTTTTVATTTPSTRHTTTIMTTTRRRLTIRPRTTTHQSSVIDFKNAMSCPMPYRNPEDWPQYCELNRRTCGENEKCVQTSSGEGVCCQRTGSRESVSTSSLMNLMTKMCGDDHSAVLTRTGDPIRCSRQRPCRRGATCKFSSVLMIDICCTKGRPSMFPLSEIPSSLTDPDVLISDSLCDSVTGEGCGSEINIEPQPLPNMEPVPLLNVQPQPLVPMKLFAGDSGCKTADDCGGQAICVRGMCACRLTQVQFHKMCYWKCPPYYRNISGVCI